VVRRGRSRGLLEPDAAGFLVSNCSKCTGSTSTQDVV
jgi:hypothetical protein